MATEHETALPNIAQIAREALEQVCSGARIDCIPTYYSPEFVDHVNDFELKGHAGARQSVRLYRKILSEMSIVVVDQVVDGERVVSRFVVNGIASGRVVSFNGITITRLKDGRIVEDWSVTDTLGMLRQLGPWRALRVLLRSVSGADRRNLTSRA
jgi:ketosteroid isomerase-like protein